MAIIYGCWLSLFTSKSSFSNSSVFSGEVKSWAGKSSSVNVTDFGKVVIDLACSSNKQGYPTSMLCMFCGLGTSEIKDLANEQSPGTSPEKSLRD